MLAGQVLVLGGAGFLAGGMNALAGGGSFVTFPALVANGVPSLAANASSTVALLPGGLASLWAYRRMIQPVGPASLPAMAGASLLGGVAGAALLLLTPTSLFDLLVPWLLLIGTLVLAAGDRPRLALRRSGLRLGGRTALGVQVLLGVYGGYFGGAVGLMMLAVWSLFSEASLKTLNPGRVVMVNIANAAATVCFMISGAVRWGPAMAVLLGAILGGYGAARVGRRLPAQVIRAAVLAVCVATTAIFFWRAYA